MKTKFITVDPLNPDKNVMAEAGALLRQGEVVAFPTETVYGLGANALDPRAVAKIFAAKGRPADNPLIVHVATVDQLAPLVKTIPEMARLLILKFWPGPLTLIFPKSPLIPPEVTAGLDTVAVRMPVHPVALELIKSAGIPVAAPSANVSGRPSPTEGKHVLIDLEGKIPLILDGGESKVGVESTVLDVTGKDPVILRPGGITREEIETIVGQVLCHQGLGKKSVPRAPGMKYVHYSPKAEVVIIAKNSKYMGNKMMTVSRNLEKEGKKVALLISRETLDEMKGLMLPHYVQVLGSRDNLPQVAHYLFSAFRNCDLSGADIILIEEFSREGMGEAVMNRILKAAGNKIIN